MPPLVFSEMWSFFSCQRSICEKKIVRKAQPPANQKPFQKILVDKHGSWHGFFFVIQAHGHGSTLISALISSYIHYKVRMEITFPFPNFSGTTAEVWSLGIDKWFHPTLYWLCDYLSTLDPPTYSEDWNYFSIPKLQRYNRWCLGMDK